MEGRHTYCSHGHPHLQEGWHKAGTPVNSYPSCTISAWLPKVPSESDSGKTDPLSTKCQGNTLRCAQPKQMTDNTQCEYILKVKFSCYKSSPRSLSLYLPLKISRSSPAGEKQRDMKRSKSHVSMTFLILGKTSRIAGWRGQDQIFYRCQRGQVP